MILGDSVGESGEARSFRAMSITEKSQSPFRIDIFTIFPPMIGQYTNMSILGRAQAAGHLEVIAHDIRDFSKDKHRSVDDSPFGGGAGMVLAPEPVFSAVESADIIRPLFLLSPGGRRFDQQMARELALSRDASGRRGFSMLCGRYEGVDERIVENLVDDEISIGDYILAGGELASLVVIEAVARLLPNVLGNSDSAVEESFTEGLLEYAQFTKPFDFRGMCVPEILRNGDHGKIAKWRKASAISRTVRQRQDMIERRGGLTQEELQLLSEYGYLVDADRHKDQAH